jgi:hypothetical protein
MNLSPFQTIDLPCDKAMQWCKEQITRIGLRSVQTFDLQAARLAAHDCPCPNHGCEDCDCQMVVLLVYGSTPEPVTLILHGNGGQTWLSFADSLRQDGDPTLLASIRKALDVRGVIKVPSGK